MKKKKRTRFIRLLKKIHKWPALIIAFIAILFAVSGIFMNHRKTFSAIDIPRQLLPPNYTYKNWNQAALRGSEPLDSTKTLIFGNVGIWVSDPDFQSFQNFNQGFPAGIDNRKVYAVKKLKQNVYAGTHHGLFKRSLNDDRWERMVLPTGESRIADLALKQDTLIVLTRSNILKSKNGIDFISIQLPPPALYKTETGLFKTLWELHSGELFGIIGKLMVDLLGIVVIFLSLGGIIHFFLPGWIRRRKKKNKNNTKSLINCKKINLKWHNLIGYTFILFLLINTATGMHLRPPLLIAIANKKVGILPGTHLDNPNPWFDKLRRILWDEDSEQFLLSTSEGFYFVDEKFKNTPKMPVVQPPVSVMGCNVLEKFGHSNYLIGSFNGMYLWNTGTNKVYDFFTQTTYKKPEGMSRPIGSHMVSGMLFSHQAAYWMDYNKGVQLLSSSTGIPVMSEMSASLRNNSKMSLWNVSLEIHTGRIFEHLVGPFYILFVPLAGICLILVLISGFLVWWMVNRGK